jgi:hypothetical protein
MLLRMQARVDSVRAAHDDRRPGFGTITRSHLRAPKATCSSICNRSAMLHSMLTSIELLTDASRSFCDRCAIGIDPNKNASQRILVIV